MSVEGLTWSELDRLADYTADALDPTDAAEVAALVRTDARWASAYRALNTADTAVRSDLSLAAQVPAAMPADVAARIDDALRYAAGANRDTGSGTVVSLDAARSARARRRPLMTGIAAAAASIAVIGGLAFASQYTAGQSSSTGDALPALGSAESEADRNAADPAPPFALPSAGAGTGTLTAAGSARVLVSGQDYRLDTLSQLALVPSAGQPQDSTSGEPSVNAAKDAPSALAGLTTPTGLAECLRAVTARYPGTPVVLDYAKFNGQPALIMVIRIGSSSTIVAVGPNCGLSGTDEKAAVPAD